MSWRDASCLICAAIERAGRAKKTQGTTVGTAHMPTAKLRWIDMFLNAWPDMYDQPIPCCTKHKVELSAALVRADS